MTFLKFISRSLWFYRRQHLAVLVGTIISTAVLTGALIIGDSVKMSLEHLVDMRLGKVKYALQSNDRFVRDQLANEISSNQNTPTASLLILDGIGINPETNTRVNSLKVNGVDDRFWSLSNIKMPSLEEDEAIINSALAQKLNIKEGSEFLLRLDKPGKIPLNSPFIEGNKPTLALRLKVKAIAYDNQLGRFSLKNNQAIPNNIFVPLNYLSSQVELEGYVNTILVAGGQTQKMSIDNLNQSLKENWQLTDAAIRIRDLKDEVKYEILSDRVFIDEQVANAILKLNYKHENVLTYLVNSIRFNEKVTPYSFVTAASISDVSTDLKENEIIINDWLANDLKVNIGDSITLDYYVIGPFRDLKEESKNFIVKRIVPVNNPIVNSTLMPDFPGLADAGSCRDWNTSIPIDLDRIRDKDEKYWEVYNGTPKAIIPLHVGLTLWNNNYGEYTAIRIDKDHLTKTDLENDILGNLNPGDLKLIFSPVYDQGTHAADNSVDFGELFLSLSFFVIAAGVLLTILLHGLNTESRKEETGVLSAMGFSNSLILLIRIYESLIIIIFGSLIGVVIGIVYNYGLLAGLNSLWNDAVRTQSLEVFILPETLLTGALGGMIIALIAIIVVSRRKLKHSVTALLRTATFSSPKEVKRNSRLNMLLMIFGFSGTGLLVLYSVIFSADENVGLFLSAGGLFMVGCFGMINRYFSHKEKHLPETGGMLQLSVKNAGRNKARSIMTIILLALGTFTIIITGANRQTLYGVEKSRSSGTGGFLFWAETTVPLMYNLNTDNGRKKLGLSDENVLNNVDFLQFYSLDGDDASCLNLNQVAQPRILGINPDDFNNRQAFSFKNLKKGLSKNNPWLELEKSFGTDIIPAIADQTVITWGLKKKVGDTLIYFNEQGKKVKLLLIAGLNNSIFQGNILISDENFRKHFPSEGGSKIMLIDASDSDKNELSELLQSRLVDYGIQITNNTERLAEFNSITNTYLSVFMALGGLGVIIGTIGLGIVLYRNMLERKQELAIMIALGYTNKHIFRLVFNENLLLLVAGLMCGLLAALIGILPSLISPSFTIPGFFMFGLIAIVFISGLIWIYFPAKRILKGNLIESLRNE